MLAAALLVSFASRLAGQEMEMHKLVKPADAYISNALSINTMEEQAKRDRYVRANNWKAEKHARQKSMAGASN
ncbi:MAG: hypothetical protein QG657_1247, partial [Acidobacteriota bacterium]|nr:hypothetical protein [Acidobacteriota bacterium]